MTQPPRAVLPLRTSQRNGCALERSGARGVPASSHEKMITLSLRESPRTVAARSATFDARASFGRHSRGTYARRPISKAATIEDALAVPTPGTRASSSTVAVASRWTPPNSARNSVRLPTTLRRQSEVGAQVARCRSASGTRVKRVARAAGPASVPRRVAYP